MNTLNETIKSIVNGKGSKAMKTAALIKLGIRAHEMPIIFSTFAMPVAPRVSRIFNRTFGLEIECDCNYHIVRSDSVNFQYMGYTHEVMRDVFKFVTDSSVEGAHAIECVSPVLSGNDGHAKVKACVKALKDAGGRVNNSCGLHVHIGAGDLTSEQYANVFANYMFLENVIDTFMARSRRGNNCHWCKTLKGRGVENAHNMSDIYNCFGATFYGEGNFPHRYERGCQRYFKVNCLSWIKYKTIEFRQHGGSLNATKINNWVKFLVKLVEWSKDNRLSAYVNSIDEIPFLTATEKRYFGGRVNELAEAA